MPLYEYLCAGCGKSCEVLQKVNDPAAVQCPHCGQDRLERQISAPRFQLKGTGWYETDFKNKPKKETKPENTADSGDKTPSAETKTDTKKESAEN